MERLFGCVSSTYLSVSFEDTVISDTSGMQTSPPSWVTAKAEVGALKVLLMTTKSRLASLPNPNNQAQWIYTPQAVQFRSTCFVF